MTYSISTKQGNSAIEEEQTKQETHVVLTPTRDWLARVRMSASFQAQQVGLIPNGQKVKFIHCDEHGWWIVSPEEYPRLERWDKFCACTLSN